MHDGPETFRFELSGNLAGAEVAKLEQAWRTASSTFNGKQLAVDVTYLTSVDDQGRELLRRWSGAGARLVATSAASRTLVASITGHPYVQPKKAEGPTFDPLFNSSAFRAVAVMLILTMTLVFPVTARAGSSDDGNAVLELYSARQENRTFDTARVSLEVEASIPRLQKQATIKAIRGWAEGKRQYQFVSIEGDRMVRNEMIARYFAADTDEAPLTAPITKSNYRFYYVTSRDGISVFEISPRRKRKGMIAGELWIDNETGRAIHLFGRLVKNPSPMLRGVRITQDMQLRAGTPWARQTHLELRTRFAGPAELNIREQVRGAEAEVTEYVAP
jgi:hypothetical protein